MANDNDLIDILSEVVSTGLRKLFSVITYDDLMKDVSYLCTLILKILNIRFKEIRNVLTQVILIFLHLCIWMRYFFAEP